MKKFVLMVAVGALVVPAAASAASPSALDASYLQGLVQANLAEIMDGNYAIKHTSEAAVKSLGTRLVIDHTKALKSAIAVAHQLRIGTPKMPNPSQDWALQQLQTLSLSAFDHAYTTVEIADHEVNITDTKTEINHGTVAAVVRLAKAALPMLQNHLKLAQAAERSLASPGTTTTSTTTQASTSSTPTVSTATSSTGATTSTTVPTK